VTDDTQDELASLKEAFGSEPQTLLEPFLDGLPIATAANPASANSRRRRTRYVRRRAAEEQQKASDAHDPYVARAHRALAAIYKEQK
jgi:hypothetical protein